MNAWQCDRCGAVSKGGNVDDLPNNWKYIHRPIRGSAGARSDETGIICVDCDDKLYEWWQK